MRYTHSSSTRRSFPALIGGLLGVLMTLVFVAPADAADNLGHPLYQISPTTSPYNTIVEITIPGYDDYTGTKAIGRCTGWVYAPNMVATAGHCVYDKTVVRNGYFDTRGIRVWPGVNGSTTNAKSCGVVKSFAPTNWMAGQSKDPTDARYDVHGNEAFDYGAFKLDCSPALQPAMKYGLPPAVGYQPRICGYPKNKAVDTQWCSDGQIRAFDAYEVFYDNDTCGRMSGAPVMVYTTAGWNVTAIHTYGRYLQSNDYNHYYYNYGTRITSTVSADLSTWQNDTSAGTPPNPPAQPQPIGVSAYCDAPPPPA